MPSNLLFEVEGRRAEFFAQRVVGHRAFFGGGIAHRLTPTPMAFGGHAIVRYRFCSRPKYDGWLSSLEISQC